MPPRVFTVKEREELRIKMLDAGFELIKKHGMTHASVEKITSAAGLGKSTFYNFFLSKEQFVNEIITYQRDRFKQSFNGALKGREKMTADEGNDFLKMIIFSQDSIYQYLTAADMEKLRAVSPPEEIAPDNSTYLEHEMDTMYTLFENMENVRDDLDILSVANLIKIMALAKVNRESLHADALEKTIGHIYGLLFSLIFEDAV